MASRQTGIGAHLLGAVIVSAVAWWLLALTSLPVPVAAWLAGVVAGIAAISVLAAAGRAAAAVLSQTSPRPRRGAR
ncbi:hypothetical protein [Streptosporangium sandarakinum]|uniref:hypothetical protein n=1 Tax=Streptosporangium sandarakinum TaxID=1260955 RepID=UPI0037123001